MRHFLLTLLILMSGLSSYAGDFFVVTFSERGPMTVEGRHRDFMWIVPADSVKRLVPTEIYPFLIGISSESIKGLSVFESFGIIYIYSSDLQKLVKKNRKKVSSFRTKLGPHKFVTTIYITPIQGDIHKAMLLNSNRNTVCYSDSFSYWEEGFESKEFFELSYKWFPSVPYRYSCDFINVMY